MELPDFLVPLQDMILITWVQMRFIGHLRQCMFVLPILADSASRQMDSMRAGVHVFEDEPFSCMASFHAKYTVITEGQAATWAPTLAWSAPAAERASHVIFTGLKERQAAIDDMITKLSVQRDADKANAECEQMRQLQQHQHLARLQELRRAKERHTETMRRAETLKSLQADAEDYLAGKQVFCPKHEVLLYRVL